VAGVLLNRGTVDLFYKVVRLDGTADGFLECHDDNVAQLDSINVENGWRISTAAFVLKIRHLCPIRNLISRRVTRV
jgi:hypothetical protein